MFLEDIRASYSVDPDQSRKSERPRKPSSPRAAAERRKPSTSNHKPRTSALDKRLLSDRIQNEREQLFKAISIVECCKYASSTLAEVDTTEYMEGVFDALCDILNSVAGELGCMVEEYRGATSNK